MRKDYFRNLACILTAALVITSITLPTTGVEAAKASSLNATKATLAVGEKFDINVKSKVKGTKYSFDYDKADGKNYVTLNKTSGLVTAKKPGTATIKCTAKKGKTVKVLKCVVTVGSKTTKVEINNKAGNGTIAVGQKFNFNDSVTPIDAVTKSVWSISDTSVFKVDVKNGWVKALKAGVATLTVKNGSFSDSVELTAAADYSAAQAGAKSIKVSSLVPMKKEDIKVIKGNGEVTLDSTSAIAFSADNREAVITTKGSLTDGSYKVSLTPDKQIEFGAVAEKVTKISFLSDKAALASTTDSKEAIVGYRVENQFGEDITKRVSVNISGSHGATLKENGTILFTKGEGNVFNQNVDIVTATIIHTETGITAQATLTVSAAKAVSEVSIKGLYNEDKKELNGDSTLEKNDFYLLVDAKDQYGMDMSDAVIGKEVFITVGPGLTKVATDAAKYTSNTSKLPRTTTIKMDGRSYMGVKLASTDNSVDGDIDPGEFTVSVIAGGNGKTATEKFTVKEGIEAVELSVIPSDMVLANKENVFTYEATDGYGKPVTSYDVLKRIQISPDGNASANKVGMRWTEDSATGNAKLIYKADTAATDTPVFSNFTLKNHKVVRCDFTVKANASPVLVKEVDKKDLNRILGGNASYDDVDIVLEKIKVEDRYGNIMSADDLANACLTTNYKIKARVENETSGIKFDIKQDLATAKNSVIFTVKYAPAGITEAQTATIVLYVEKDGVEVGGSDYKFEVSLLPSSKLGTYSVEDIKTIYSATPAGVALFGGQYGKEIKVTAKRGDTIVKLLPGDYNVSVPDFLTFSQSDGKLYCNRTEEFEKDIKEMTGEIIVTINQTGESIKKNVVMKNEEPKVVSVEPKGTSEDIINGQNQVFNIVSIINRGGIRYTIKDQYGAEAGITGTNEIGFYMAKIPTDNPNVFTSKHFILKPTVTFSEIDGNGIRITNNGTPDATATFSSAQSSKSVKVTLDFDGVKRSFKIYG